MAGARGLWRATGMKDGDFGKPIIAVVNSFTQFVSTERGTMIRCGPGMFASNLSHDKKLMLCRVLPNLNHERGKECT